MLREVAAPGTCCQALLVHTQVFGLSGLLFCSCCRMGWVPQKADLRRYPLTSAFTSELYVGLELVGRLTELLSYVVLCSIMSLQIS